MIKSKLSLVLSGESPKSISTGTPGNQILGQKKNKIRAPLFSFLHDTPLSGSKKVGELFFYFCFSFRKYVIPSVLNPSQARFHSSLSASMA